jgi:hypothetical protein
MSNDEDEDNSSNDIFINIDDIEDKQQRLNAIFFSKTKSKTTDKYKSFNYNFDSWNNNETRLVKFDGTVIELLTKNKNINIDISLNKCRTDVVFNSIIKNYPLNKTKNYDNYILSSNFVNKIIIENIINSKLLENSLKLESFLILDFENKMDGYLIHEPVLINNTLANLNLDNVKIVFNDKEIKDNDVKCFFILDQLLKIFTEIELHDFNHGKLTAYNVIIDIDDKYITQKQGKNKDEEEKEDEDEEEKEEFIKQILPIIQSNFKIKIYNFSQSSITYKNTRFVSDFPKKLGLFKDNFTQSNYDEMGVFYEQLKIANENGTIKNTIKDNKLFKKMLRHSPVPVPFTIEFYILIMSMMLCNDSFFIFFRKYYFDLLFDYNLTDAVLEDATNNKIVKSCVSYKIYKSIMNYKNNSNSIDIPLSILDGISFKMPIVKQMNVKNETYIGTINSHIEKYDESDTPVDIYIYNVIKEMNEISNISNIDSNEIPNKLIIYVNQNLSDKNLIKYYKTPIIFNFDTSRAYEENKMSDVKSSFFKDKNAFKTLVDRFNIPNVPINIYNAEISNGDKLGIVDNNILLTIKKSFQINKKIKLNDGKIYTIIDAKWEPGTWVKKTFGEIDDVEKIKNISKKKVKSYGITKDLVSEKILEKKTLSYKPYNSIENKNYNNHNPYEIKEPTSSEETTINVQIKKINFKKNIHENVHENVLDVFKNIETYKIPPRVPLDELKNKIYQSELKLSNSFDKTSINLNNFNIEQFIKIFGYFFSEQTVFCNFPLDTQIAILSTTNTQLFESNNQDNPDNSDYNLYYNKFNISEDNMKMIIDNNVNNDVTYNNNLKKIYNNINVKENNFKEEYKIFLKYELIFLKTCYNYHKLYTETKHEFDAILSEIKKYIEGEVDITIIKNQCIKIYYLKYFHKCRKLIYNYYLHGFYWWIINSMNYFNNEVTFTKEIINKSFFFNKQTQINQSHYDLIIDMKDELYIKILDLLFELQIFYQNNENIQIFSQNMLMDMLKNMQQLNNLLNPELSQEIHSDIVSQNVMQKYKIVNIKNDENIFFNSLIHALKNKFNPDDFLYNKNIIKILNESVENTSLENERQYDNSEKLKDSIINSIQFKNEINEYKKEYKQNSEFNDIHFMMKVVSKIFNCMIYKFKYDDKEQLINSMSNYDNQKYTIILCENGLISFTDKIAMTCNELPDKLQIYQYCYNKREPLVVEPSAPPMESAELPSEIMESTELTELPSEIMESTELTELPSEIMKSSTSTEQPTEQPTVVELPAPTVVELPAPTVELPAPTVELPAPTVELPAPTIESTQIGGLNGDINDIKEHIKTQENLIVPAKKWDSSLNNDINKILKQIKIETDIQKRKKLEESLKRKQDEKLNVKNRLIKYYNEIIKRYTELIKTYEKQPVIEQSELNYANINKQQYESKLKILKNELTKETEKNKKVYGIILNLTLYPGENPSIVDKQNYKCKNSFNNLKKEYCNVFGIGCNDTKKTNNVKNKKYTMKNKK